MGNPAATGWHEPQDRGWRVEVRQPNGPGNALVLVETYTHLAPGPILMIRTGGDGLGCSVSATITCGDRPAWRRNYTELTVVVIGGSGTERPLFLGRVTNIDPAVTPDGFTWAVSLTGHGELVAGQFYSSNANAVQTLSPGVPTHPAFPTTATLNTSAVNVSPTDLVGAVLSRALEPMNGRGTWGVRPERVAVMGLPESGNPATISALGRPVDPGGYEEPPYTTDWKNWPGAGWQAQGGTRGAGLLVPRKGVTAELLTPTVKATRAPQWYSSGSANDPLAGATLGSTRTQSLVYGAGSLWSGGVAHYMALFGDNIGSVYYGSADYPGAASTYRASGGKFALQYKFYNLSNVAKCYVVVGQGLTTNGGDIFTFMPQTDQLKYAWPVVSQGGGIISTSDFTVSEVAEGAVLSTEWPVPSDVLTRGNNGSATVYAQRFIMFGISRTNTGQAASASVDLKLTDAGYYLDQLGPATPVAVPGWTYPDTVGPAHTVRLEGAALGPLYITDLTDGVSQYAAGTDTTLTPDDAYTEVRTHVLPWR